MSALTDDYANASGITYRAWLEVELEGERAAHAKTKAENERLRRALEVAQKFVNAHAMNGAALTVLGVLNHALALADTSEAP